MGVGAAPDYPAVMYYEAASDQPFWVECEDRFTIHVARRRNPAAEALLRDGPQFDPLAVEASGWGNLLLAEFERLSVSVLPISVFSGLDAPTDGIRLGYQLRVGDTLVAVQQMHVDWGGLLHDVGRCCSALAEAAAKKLSASRLLYTAPLRCPETAESLPIQSYGLHGRVLRCLSATCDEDGTLLGIIPMTRIDILYAVHP
jgi:hypothetical protein